MLSFIRKHPTFAVAILCMLVFLGVMLLPPTGAAALRKTEAKSLANARKICLVCRQYSREHAGLFPPSLDTLFPQYLQDRSILASPLQPAEPVGYTYTPPGPGLTDSPTTIVIEDKFAPSLGHIRLVIYANGSGGPLQIP